MNNYFPTDFAQKVAMKIDLFPIKGIEEFDLESDKKKKRKEARIAYDLYERLTEFQNISIAGSFKESLIAYDGVDLSPIQRKTLKKIHKSTVTWAKGNMVAKIMDKYSEARSGKETKDLSEILMAIIGIETVGDKKDTGKGIKALVIETYSEDK